jgi:hypothetical protein
MEEDGSITKAFFFIDFHPLKTFLPENKPTHLEPFTTRNSRILLLLETFSKSNANFANLEIKVLVK